MDLDAAESVSWMFDDGVESVTLTEIGQVLGCGAAEVVVRFGSARRLAAVSFHRHLPSISGAVDRRADAGGSLSLADGVYELARCVLTDRQCALALLHERLDSRSQGIANDPSSDIHSLVPLAELFSAPLGVLADCPESERIDLADLVVDTVLGYGATHPRGEIAKITELTLRLVPVNF